MAGPVLFAMRLMCAPAGTANPHRCEPHRGTIHCHSLSIVTPWGTHLATGLTLPSSPSDRRKLFIALGICVVCLLWLGYYFLSQVNFTGPDRTLDTPGWKIVNDMYTKLTADHAYADVALKVDTEKPLKIIVMGEVYSKDDFDRLPKVLKELNAEAEYDIQAEYKKK